MRYSHTETKHFLEEVNFVSNGSFSLHVHVHWTVGGQTHWPTTSLLQALLAKGQPGTPGKSSRREARMGSTRLLNIIVNQSGSCSMQRCVFCNSDGAAPQRAILITIWMSIGSRNESGCRQIKQAGDMPHPVDSDRKELLDMPLIDSELLLDSESKVGLQCASHFPCRC